MTPDFANDSSFLLILACASKGAFSDGISSRGFEQECAQKVAEAAEHASKEGRKESGSGTCREGYCARARQN
jgi:hypothetical protein